MKITFITTKLNLDSGGGSNHSLNLVASKLVGAGNQVSVLTLFPVLNAFPRDLPYQVIVDSENSRDVFTQKDTLSLRNVLRKYEKDVDIYHLWDPLLVFGGAIYRLFGGRIPVVAYLNGYTFCTNLDRMDAVCYQNCGLVSQIKHRPEKPIRKALLVPLRIIKHYAGISISNKIDAFISISPAVSDIYSLQHFDKNKMHVIPPGIDMNQLARLKTKYALQPFNSKNFNIIFVGRLEWLKGVDLLIKAISKLDSTVNLQVVGDGPQRNELESLAAQLGLSKRVFFHGWVSFEDVVSHYMASQLFVHPARWPEPLGRTILDAMALGLPAIVPDCGGAAWAVKDAGLVFQSGDVDDLADEIRSVLNNPSLAEEMRKKSQNRAKDFDCSQTIPRLIEVYKGLIP